MMQNPEIFDGFLPILLGETDEGKSLCIDLEQCPHLLVAGSTGSGKSTVLHTIIHNLRKRNDTNLTLIDTKLVEFNIYKNQVYECVTNYDSTIIALQRIYNQMNQKYELLSKWGLSSIKDCPNLRKHVIIIDEVSDLMLQQEDKEFENLLIRLAQKARAAGIYIILATQRPSADIITGLIKSNFPARLACKVASKVDARVVMDCHGAENLNGKGDALIKTPKLDLTRFQVAYINPRVGLYDYN